MAALHEHIAKEGVLQPPEGPALLVVPGLVALPVVHHGRGQDAGIGHRLDDLRPCLIRGPLLKSCVDLDLRQGLDPVLVRFVFVEEVLPPDDAAQLLEVPVLEGRDQRVPRFESLLRVLGIRIVGLAADDDPVDGELGVPVPPPLADDAEAAVERYGIPGEPGRGLHLGELDHGPEPGLPPPVDRRQDPVGDQGAGGPVDDPVGGLEGMPTHVLVHPGDRGEAGVGLAQDIVGAAKDLGPIAKAAAPHVDEPRVDLLEGPVAHLPPVERPGPVQLGQPVALPDQVVEYFPHLRDVVVHRQVELVDVRPEEAETGPGHRTGVVQRIQVRLVEGGGVPHGVPHPRDLDLDHLGPQLGQVGRGVGREDIHGTAQPPDPLQRLGL